MFQQLKKEVKFKKIAYISKPIKRNKICCKRWLCWERGEGGQGGGGVVK